MSRIDAVLFDYGMVLSGPPDMSARARMEVLLRTTPEHFHEAYWRSRDAYDRGSLSGAAYWRAVADDLGRPLDATTLVALIAADNEHWTQPNEPMIAWARALRAAGISTGILSNIGDAMEMGVRARFPWLDEFTHCTFSHRLGIAKPDTAIYHHAARGLGVSPEQILFIDDRAENVAAARSVGMAAIQYRDHAAFLAELQAEWRAEGLDLL